LKASRISVNYLQKLREVLTAENIKNFAEVLKSARFSVQFACIYNRVAGALVNNRLG